MKFRQVLKDHPERWDLTLKIADTIGRLVRMHNQISKERKHDLKNAIEKVITEIAVPLRD
jgi:hypothetical protein